MKKFVLGITAGLPLLSLCACGNNIQAKAIEQGKLMMANGDYAAASNSFKMAIDEGSKDVNVKTMYEILSQYLDAKSAYENGDFEKSTSILANINASYQEYSIKKDVDQLKTATQTGIENAKSIALASEYITQEKYTEARVALDLLKSEHLSADQKRNVDAMNTVINDRLKTAPQSPIMLVPQGYYVPSQYSGIVPEYNGDYLYPSSSQYITSAYLALCSKTEVALIRNEIYARHGYVFQKPEYIHYFGQKSWYHANPDFNEGMLNSIEKENIQTIKQYESSMGWS